MSREHCRSAAPCSAAAVCKLSLNVVHISAAMYQVSTHFCARSLLSFSASSSSQRSSTTSWCWVYSASHLASISLSFPDKVFSSSLWSYLWGTDK